MVMSYLSDIKLYGFNIIFVILFYLRSLKEIIFIKSLKSFFFNQQFFSNGKKESLDLFNMNSADGIMSLIL